MSILQYCAPPESDRGCVRSRPQPPRVFPAGPYAGSARGTSARIFAAVLAGCWTGTTAGLWSGMDSVSSARWAANSGTAVHDSTPRGVLKAASLDCRPIRRTEPLLHPFDLRGTVGLSTDAAGGEHQSHLYDLQQSQMRTRTTSSLQKCFGQHMHRLNPTDRMTRPVFGSITGCLRCKSPSNFHGFGSRISSAIPARSRTGDMTLTSYTCETRRPGRVQ